MADIVLLSEAVRAEGADEAAALVRSFCEPLPTPEEIDGFGAFFDRFADAKLILLGEASHGTSEFYKARAAITRRLIQQHGFNIVAVEADWPDAARIDHHVRHHAHEPSSEEAFSRFPAWMWRNIDVHDFVEWLRAHNEHLPAEARTEFRGLDIYSLGSSIAAILASFSPISTGSTLRKPKRHANDTGASPHGRMIPLATAAPRSISRNRLVKRGCSRNCGVCSTGGSLMFAATANPSSMPRRTRGWCGLRNITIASCTVAPGNHGICETGTCSTLSC